MVDAMTRTSADSTSSINNAGIGATGHFADATEERLRQIFEVNFFGLGRADRASACRY